MGPRTARVLLASAVAAVSLAGCGAIDDAMRAGSKGGAGRAGAAAGGDAASAVEDLIAVAAGTPDDVRVLVAREADAVGTSSEEVARTWVQRLRDAEEAYLSVPQDARSFGCDLAGDWVRALVTPEEWDDGAAAEAVRSAVGGLNRNLANHQLAKDLEDALEKRARGEPIYLQVLVVKTGICQAAGMGGS